MNKVFFENDVSEHWGGIRFAQLGTKSVEWGSPPFYVRFRCNGRVVFFTQPISQKITPWLDSDTSNK